MVICVRTLLSVPIVDVLIMELASEIQRESIAIVLKVFMVRIVVKRHLYAVTSIAIMVLVFPEMIVLIAAVSKVIRGSIVTMKSIIAGRSHV